MKPTFSLAAAALGCCLLTTPALAQSSAAGGSGTAFGTIQNGNTTIVFEPANTSDLNLGMYSVWTQFAQDHPDTERQLSRKPSLISNDNYLKRHPDLAQFFEQHPDVKSAMIANPGNFLPV